MLEAVRDMEAFVLGDKDGVDVLCGDGGGGMPDVLDPSACSNTASTRPVASLRTKYVRTFSSSALLGAGFIVTVWLCAVWLWVSKCLHTGPRARIRHECLKGAWCEVVNASTP